MKTLFERITQLLSEIPELRWIDFDTGQLQEEKPSVAYPCALVEINLPRCEDIDNDTQQVYAEFSVLLAFKAMGETNTAAPVPQRSLALQYFDTVNKVERKLHGYRSEQFYPFSRVSVRNENIRRGLKVVRLSFQTAWRVRIANS